MDIAIIDYGAGNTANVKNALAKLGVDVVVTSNSEILQNSDALVLPGVGSFGAAIGKLSAGNNMGSLSKLAGQKPFLGICLGMQLLFEESEESLGVDGFGLLKGKVKKFTGDLPVPHTGWNKVILSSKNPSPLFDGMGDFYAYFVHSYYCDPIDRSTISASTSYGESFPSVISTKNIFLTQFHPEKSGVDGLRLLENFVKIIRR
jgi:glutamine amidotransferase